MSEPSASEGDKPSERIYLQYYGDEEPSEGPAMEVSWCGEKIYEHDVGYVRPESIARWLEANAAEMRSRERGSQPLQLARASAISTLEEAAREIRGGAYHEGET